MRRELERGDHTAKDTNEDISDDAIKIIGLCTRYWGKVYRRPPLITAGLITACLCVYYIAGEGNKPGASAKALRYYPGANLTATIPRYEWYRPLAAMFSHVSDDHLWMNMVMVLLIGSLFEYSEGFWNTINVVWGAGVIGFAFHGAFRSNAVRGACLASSDERTQSS